MTLVSICRLAGNPFCTTFSGSPVCQVSSQGPQTWVGGPNPSCHASCDGGKVLNPKLCSCASPLVCHMQLTSPAFSRVNDTTIESLSSEWAQFFTTSTTLSVHLDPKQVYIGDANFTDDGRMLHDMSFFPYVGDSLNTTEVFNILKALTSQVFHLKEGPYLLLGFTPPPTGTSLTISHLAYCCVHRFVCCHLKISSNCKKPSLRYTLSGRLWRTFQCFSGQ